jgi:hypothetical protein
MCVISVGLFASEKSSEITQLSSGLKNLLSQEMIAVDKSMKNIFHHMISANFEELSKEAIGIQNSFILKKKLTKEQKIELHSNVSNEFITLDKQFHVTAGKLANAAEFEDIKEINKYFTQMTNSCIQCHSTFATYKFSNFK